ARRDVGHRASAATHPVGFFNRPFWVAFRRASPASGGSTVCLDTLFAAPRCICLAERATQAAWSVRNAGLWLGPADSTVDDVGTARERRRQVAGRGTRPGAHQQPHHAGPRLVVD